MDVAAFYTRVASAPAPVAQGSAPNAKGVSAGIDGFLDFLLASLEPAGESKESASDSLQNGAPAPDALEGLIESLPENPSLDDLLDAFEKAGISDPATLSAFVSGDKTGAAVSAKAEILALLRKILGDASTEDLATISEALGANDNFIAANGNSLIASKKEILDTLDALISSGLTPAQIAELGEKLKALEAEKGAAMDAAFLALLLGQSEGSVEGQAISTLETDIRALLAQATTAQNSEPSEKSVRQPTFDLLSALKGSFERKLLIGPAPEASQDGEILLSLENAGTKNKLSAFVGGPEGLAPKTQGPAAPALVAQLAAKDETKTLSGAGWNMSEESFEEWLGRVSGASVLISAGQSVATAPGTIALSPQTTSGASAASQIVAISIYRAAQGGEARTLTLHLEPSELGRVAVKLALDKNRALRTVLTVEKPETHSLLQRDAHLLERALQNAGIDTSSGDSLSFELASEGFDFGGGEERGGGGTGAGESSNGMENASVTQTHMDWYVDSQTGLMHYDILA